MGVLLFAGACASDGSAGPGNSSTPDAGSNVGPGLLTLAPPADGFQVHDVGQTIDAQTDIEYCEIVKLPGAPSDTYYVHAFDSQMTSGSHHLIVSAIVPGSPTEATVTPGLTVECPFGARVFGEDLEPVTGGQHLDNSEAFPDGVGRKYQGGQLIVFDYHYLNTTDSPVYAQAAVNFHTVDGATVKHLARSFSFNNFTIDTPIGQTRAFKGECRFNQDTVVGKLIRHTHRWGRDFTVTNAGGAHAGEIVFQSPDWETTDYVYPAPTVVKAGEGFQFECQYKNDSDHELKFGVKATDEMCILFGTIWEPDGAPPIGGQSCQLFQIGTDGVARP